MISDGVGGYHGRAELGLLRGEGLGDVSACVVCGARVLVSVVGRVGGWEMGVQPDGPRLLRR